MKGRARARCGVTVVNAFATSRGACFAVDLFVDATVVLRDDRTDVRVTIEPEKDEDPSLAREVARRVLDRVGLREVGADVETRSDLPAAMGLKTSSAAANAIAKATSLAAQRYDGEALADRDLLGIAVDAALAAKVTVTGAFDDASASWRGGLCVTDNAGRALLARHEAPDLVAVLRLADAKARKADLARLDYAHVRPVVALAHEHALRGDWRTAMTLNGLAYGSVLGADYEAWRRAIAAGALAVSVNGGGPSVAAICPPDAAAGVRAALGGDTRVARLANAGLEVLA